MNAIQKIIFNSFISIPSAELKTYKNDVEGFHADSLETALIEGIPITAEDIQCVYEALFPSDELEFETLTPHEQSQIDAMFD